MTRTPSFRASTAAVSLVALMLAAQVAHAQSQVRYGRITAVHAVAVPDTKSGTPGADAVKVKGTITWVGVHDALPVELRLFERLFSEDQPDAGGRDFRAALNPNSRKVVRGYTEPSVASAQADGRFQFERHGYFVADRVDSRPGAPVFNRAVTLKDSWGKAG